MCLCPKHKITQHPLRWPSPVRSLRLRSRCVTGPRPHAASGSINFRQHVRRAQISSLNLRYCLLCPFIWASVSFSLAWRLKYTVTMLLKISSSSGESESYLSYSHFKISLSIFLLEHIPFIYWSLPYFSLLSTLSIHQSVFCLSKFLYFGYFKFRIIHISNVESFCD